MEKVKLIGFDIPKAELAVINNIIKGYLNKINRFIKYKELQIRLKKSKHGKNFLHEVKGKIETDKKIFNAETTDYNLFYAISETLEKLLHEIEHFAKK